MREGEREREREKWSDRRAIRQCLTVAERGIERQTGADTGRHW